MFTPSYPSPSNIAPMLPHPNRHRKTAQTRKPNHFTSQTWDGETSAQPIPTKKQKHPKAAATTLPHASCINQQTNQSCWLLLKQEGTAATTTKEKPIRQQIWSTVKQEGVHSNFQNKKFDPWLVTKLFFVCSAGKYLHNQPAIRCERWTQNTTHSRHHWKKEG